MLPRLASRIPFPRSFTMSSSQTPSPPPNLINLLRGWPSPDVLPAALLSTASQRVLASRPVYTPLLQYGPDEGYPELRSGLASWLGRHFNVKPDPARICITGGASQNLARVLQSFTDPVVTRAVWMVAPCYHLACPMFGDAGFSGRLHASPEDMDGIDVDVLEENIRALERDEAERGIPKDTTPFKDPGQYKKHYKHIIYCVPTCANPSGKTMPITRRKALVALARKYDALVICDDVYDFLQWPTNGDPPADFTDDMRLPRLCDIDLAMAQADNDPKAFGHAISNGSFSKIAGPGVRTGWVEASPAFVKGLSQTGSTLSGGAPSQLSAGILSNLVETGELEKHIMQDVRPSLQRRHRLLTEAIHEHLSPLGAEVRASSLEGSKIPIYGGYFIWFTLPEEACSFPTSFVFDMAKQEENLVIGHGMMFAVHGDEESVRFDRDIRLSFSWEPEANMVEGVRRLGRLLRRMKENKKHYETKALEVQAAGGAQEFK